MLTPFGTDKVVKPLGPLAERAKLGEAMQQAGWSSELTRKVLGENWLRYLALIWDEAAAA